MVKDVRLTVSLNTLKRVWRYFRGRRRATWRDTVRCVHGIPLSRECLDCESAGGL